MKYVTHRSKLQSTVSLKESVFSTFSSHFLNILFVRNFQNSVFQLLKTVKFFFKSITMKWTLKTFKKELVRLKMVDFHFRLSDLTSDQSVFLLRTRIGTLRCKSVSVWPIIDFTTIGVQMILHLSVPDSFTIVTLGPPIWLPIGTKTISGISIDWDIFMGTLIFFGNSYVIQLSIFGIQRCLQKFAT